VAHDNLPSEPTASLWSGVFLPVEYKGHSIVAQNSSWTSRETIWVDGEVVSSKSSWKFISEQNIQVGSETLATRFGWAKRGFIFEVFAGDTLVASADYSITWKQVLPFVLLGMVFGFSVEYFNLLG
jgi:hypothetical protein